MRKITLLLLLVSSIVLSQEKLKLKGVTIQNDPHEKVSWIKSKPIALENKDFFVSPLEVSYIQLYYGLKEIDGKPFITDIRIINNFQDNDWIFYDEVSYLLGSRKEIRQSLSKVFKLEELETTRSVKNGVTEFSDEVITNDIKDLIREVINQSKTRLSIRFINNNDSRYREFVINTKEMKKHFEALITSYNQLNKHYSLEKQF